MSRRFRRALDKEDIYKHLGDSEEQVFLNMKDVFLMAVFIGFDQDDKKPFSGGNTFGPGIFSPEEEYVLNALVIADTGNFNLLLETDQAEEADVDEGPSRNKNVIIEEFANAGINLLKRKIIDNPGYELDNLIELIFKQEKSINEETESSLNELGDIL